MNTEAKAAKAVIYATKSFKGACCPKGKGKRRASKARRRHGKAVIKNTR